MANYYGYACGITKTIKSNFYQKYLKEVTNWITRYHLGTKMLKVFDDVKYIGSITGYDHKKKLFHII